MSVIPSYRQFPCPKDHHSLERPTILPPYTCGPPIPELPSQHVKRFLSPPGLKGGYLMGKTPKG